MIIEYIDNGFEKTGILIHGIGMNANGFRYFKSELGKKYNLILPTLSGHYEHSVWNSLSEEAETIIRFLDHHQINNIEFIFGSSLGSVVAYEIYKMHPDRVSHIIMDSPPLFQYSYMTSSILSSIIMIYLSRFIKNPDRILKYDYLFGKGTLDLQKFLKICHKNTLKNIVRDVLHNKIMRKNNRVFIVYGGKDPFYRFFKFRRRFDFYVKQGYTHAQMYRDRKDFYIDLIHKEEENEV